MKAIYQDKFGGPEVLKVGEMPDPKPAANEVVLEVKAGSMNPVDSKVRSGALWFLSGRKFPKVLGCDVAGEVIEVGSAVTRFKKGDAVVGMVNAMSGKQGANAQRVAIEEQSLVSKPAGVSFLDAGALPVGALTAWQGLKIFGNVVAGNKVLINGASGGVGVFAVQLGKLLGAEVTGVCGAKNADFVRSLGATDVVDYAKEDFRNRATKYDVIFDIVNTAPFASCKKVLVPRGLWVATLPSPQGMLGKLTSAWRPMRSIWRSTSRGRSTACRVRLCTT